MIASPQSSVSGTGGSLIKELMISNSPVTNPQSAFAEWQRGIGNLVTANHQSKWHGVSGGFPCMVQKHLNCFAHVWRQNSHPT